MQQHACATANRRRTPALAGLLAALALGGCAQNYVVLLPDADGSVGQISVSSATGVAVLDQAQRGVRIGGGAGESFAVSPEQVQQDFGAALAASPSQPARFVLYFEKGGAELTADSQAEVARIRQELAGRPGVDLAVIGHSDTVGDPRRNAELGLARAQSVLRLILPGGFPPERLTVSSHGESNLLVPTPDETDEPRNRGVEVWVR